MVKGFFITRTRGGVLMGTGHRRLRCVLVFFLG
jgi:hypothetical protein